MKQAANIFFVSLGVIFLILILFGVFFFLVDPLNLRAGQGASAGNGVNNSAAADKNPQLNASQEQALQSFGIDPASVPSSISPEQEACFEEKLGKERVNEIKGGASPTMQDYMLARGCL